MEKDDGKQKSLKRSLIEWAITLAVGVAILYFWAPASWWQFGPRSPDARTSTNDFTFRALDGRDWNFGQHRGKVIVINYWATWCGPCRFETPGLVRVANEMTPRGVEFVGVTVDQDLGKVPAFVQQYSVPYIIVTPGNDPNDKLAEVLPTTFLYDRNGSLAKTYTGIVLESTLRSDIEKLLSE